jgi:hypothetical protein
MTLTSLSDVDVEEVAAALYDELDALEVEEVLATWRRGVAGEVDASEVSGFIQEELPRWSVSLK